MAGKEPTPDAPWKIMQENTFKRWANEHLKKRNMLIENLETDLADGLKLAALIEVLTGKKFPRLNQNPKFRPQKLDNVTKVLTFLEEEAKLRLVSIDSSHIVDGNGKLILGLMWSLIMHYNISLAVWEGEASMQEKERTGARERLMNHLKQKMCNYPIKNFTTDWKDGIAIGALVDSCAPGLCPDWPDWNPQQALNNATEAMVAAEQWLDIPQLIQPHEMIDPHVDDKAMMTYLSQFPTATLKPGAPLRPRTDSGKVKAYGAGLNATGNCLGQICKFTVDTAGAGRGTVEVIVLNPKGGSEPCNIVANKDDRLSHTCTFTPRIEGPHRVIVKFANREIPNSPFTVNIDEALGDPSKVQVYGSGVEADAGNCVGKRTFFNVVTEKAGRGKLGCVIIDPFGRRDSVQPRITQPDGSSAYFVEYTPKEAGVHQIALTFADQPLPNSPFAVSINPRESNKTAAVAALSAVIGLQNGDANLFKLVSNGETLNGSEFLSSDKSQANSQDPMCHENREQTSVNNELADATPLCVLTKNGRLESVDKSTVDFGNDFCSLLVNNGQNEESHLMNNGVELFSTNNGLSQDLVDCSIDQKQFHENSSCLDLVGKVIQFSTCRADLAYISGRGIQEQGIRVGETVSFFVHTQHCGQQAQLSATMTRSDGSRMIVNCEKLSEDLWNCTYKPLHPGTYDLRLRYGDADVTKTPYNIQIGVDKDIPVVAFGHGLLRGKVNQPTIFTVACRGASNKITFLMKGPSEARLDCVDNGDATTRVTYWVTEPGEYALHVLYEEEDIKYSPFMPMIELEDSDQINPGKIRVHGSGIETVATLGQPVDFFVDNLKDAIPASLYASLTNANLGTVLQAQCYDSIGNIVPLRVHRRPNGTVVYGYTPISQGFHTIEVLLCDIPVKGVPFRVNVLPEVDAKKVNIWGTGLEVGVAGEQMHFFADTSEAIPVGSPSSLYTANPLSVKITDNHGQSVPVNLSQQPNGTTRVDFMSLKGATELRIVPMLGGKAVRAMPIRVALRPKVDVNKIKVEGVDSNNSLNGDDSGYVASDFDCNFTINGEGIVDSVDLQPSISMPNHDHLLPSTNGMALLTTEVYYVSFASVNSSTKYDSSIPPQVIDPQSNSSSLNGKESSFQQGTCMHICRRHQSTVNGVATLKNRVRSSHSPEFHTHLLYEIPRSAQDFSSDLEFNGIAKCFTNAFHIHIKNQGMCNCQDDVTGHYQIASDCCPNGGDSEVNGGHDRDLSHTNIAASTGGNNGMHPPRPFVTDEEKNLLIARSKWAQCSSPDRIAASISASGPGLALAEASKPMIFTIDSRSAPSAPLNVTITGPSETDIICMDNCDGTCDVSYQPTVPGLYVVNVVYNEEEHISGSPFFVPIYPLGRPDLVTDEIRTYGPSITTDAVYVSSYIKFTVDASAIDRRGDGEVSAKLSGPGNDRFACTVRNNKDGTYTCNYTPLETGAHQLEIQYEGVPVAGSPFPFKVIPGFDANRVTAFGPGLDGNAILLPGEQTYFTVDLTGAGQGGLRVVVEGPSNTPIECQDNRDGTCTVSYTPTDPGDYQVFVRLNETLVPSMPVLVKCRAKKDPSMVQCYGPGLESGYLRAGYPAYFTVDTKNAGLGELQVRYTPKPGAPLQLAQIQPLGTAALQSTAQQHLQQYYHKVTYTPESDGLCSVEVLFDNAHVPGSPYQLRVRKACEPECIRVYGAGVEKTVAASLPASFTVDAREAGMGDLTLIVTDPNGHRIPVRVFPLSADNESAAANGIVPSVTSLASGDVSDTGLLSCTYEPNLVGAYKVHVIFAGVEVGKSPFTVHSKSTGKADKCRIEGDLSSIVPIGLEQIITVNTSQAGKGRLTCHVTQPSAEPGGPPTVIPVELEDHRNGTISAYFTPMFLGNLNVELRYGGKLIREGAFTQRVLERKEFEHMTTVARYRPVEFRLPAPKGNVIFESSVVRPSGTQQPVSHILNDDQTLSILYEPVEQGMHQLHVNYYPAVRSDDVPLSSLMNRVQGSPYKFFIDSISTGRVTAHGSGLSHGFVKKPAEFLISAKDAGGGGLFMSVEGPSNAEITSKENGDGTCSVSYLPLRPGQYTVNIKFNGEDIMGSPFTAYISEGTSEHAQIHMGSPGDFSLDTFDGDVSTLTSTVRSPSGHEETCILKRLPNNRLGISFTPKETGEHLISVYHGMSHIHNSPFRVHITEKEIGSSNSVKVSGPGILSGQCNQINVFTVDTRSAGFSNLDLSIVGPSKAEIECTDNNDGTCAVKYIPNKNGEYAITVKYAGQHVPGSPFKVFVTDKLDMVSSQQMQGTTGEVLSISNIGRRCEMSLHMKNVLLKDLEAHVTMPSGQIIRCDVTSIDPENYSVRFAPQELGEHLICVKHRGTEIEESPFTFNVGPVVEGKIASVNARGAGLTHGYANESNEFEISTKEAGAGTLAIVIEGPSKAIVECEERGDGSSRVHYQVQKPGTYSCSIKFNGSHIEGSPFHIKVTDKHPQKQIISRDLRQGLISPPEQDTFKPQVGRPVSFIVHYKGQSDQTLLAKVNTPSGVVENANVLHIEQDQYSVRFVPRATGPHMVHVHAIPMSAASNTNLMLGPNSPYPPISGSPFRLVISQHVGDPGLVYASGAGLSHGIVDEENLFLVHTAGAGSGVLNMTMHGPSKVSLLTQEHMDGYVCRYIAPIAGDYQLNIKYGGDFHIPGSPFKVKIVGSRRHSLSLSPDHVTPTLTGFTAAEGWSKKSYAERVRCQGLGLRQADLNSLNYFTLDASNAGSGTPKIIVCGPSQIVNEAKIHPQDNNRFSVGYRVTEIGQHLLLVKWNDEHVPGSPFTVDVV